MPERLVGPCGGAVRDTSSMRITTKVDDDDGAEQRARYIIGRWSPPLAAEPNREEGTFDPPQSGSARGPQPSIRGSPRLIWTGFPRLLLSEP